MTAAPAISLQGIGKTFGRCRALIDIDLNLPAGQRHALVGPNGSGKTTLLRLMGGRIAPESGTVVCLGRAWRTERRSLLPDVAYVAQTFSLYGELTIEENSRFVADLHGVAWKSRAVTRALDAFGLSALRGRRADAVSVGVRQRLMLATALMRLPKLLLLDEPTAALDQASRALLLTEIDAAQIAGTTVVLTTHNAGDLESCDSVTALQGGRVLEHRTRAARETD